MDETPTADFEFRFQLRDESLRFVVGPDDVFQGVNLACRRIADGVDFAAGPFPEMAKDVKAKQLLRQTEGDRRLRTTE